jgi:hypothetical protein
VIVDTGADVNAVRLMAARLRQKPVDREQLVAAVRTAAG